MAKQPKKDEEQTDKKEQASTPTLDRLERLASAAATASQDRQWRARKNGLQDSEDASEVRDLSQNAEARAQAEAAMKQMMAKPKGKTRKW